MGAPGAVPDEVHHAKCEDVKSMSEQRLVARLGTVNLEIQLEIGRVLRFLLDL